MNFESCDLKSFRDLVCNTLLIKIKTIYINQKYTLYYFAAIILMPYLFKGERGDSNPRIAAPQAAALTTWRRPPYIYESNNLWANFHINFPF